MGRDEESPGAEGLLRVLLRPEPAPPSPRTCEESAVPGGPGSYVCPTALGWGWRAALCVSVGHACPDRHAVGPEVMCWTECSHRPHPPPPVVEL